MKLKLMIIFSDSSMTGNFCSDLQMLKLQAKESVRSAHAEGTRRNMMIQWKAFFLFCLYFNFNAVPCDLETVCLFACTVSE